MHGIQASCPTLDLNAACTGFLYALDMADGLLRSGKAKKILIVCAEQPSKFVNWQERDTCILFGDAAGAVIVSNEGEDALFNIGTRYIGALYCPMNYGNSPFCKHDKEDKPFLQMKGKEVFKAAVQYCTSDIKTILEKSGKTIDEIDYFLLHQANMRILETIRTNIGIPEEKMPHNLERTGNTSSASVPVLLDEMNKKGKLKEGDTLIFSTFGSGFTSGACIIKW
jgi:3-oxoacyl-[acyl-carrier-protein] synthase-3